MKRQFSSSEFLIADHAVSFWSTLKMSALPVAAAIFAAAIFIIDTFVKFDVAIAALYGAIVLMSATVFDRRGVIAVAAACMMMTLVSFAVQHSSSVDERPIARCIISLLVTAITTVLTLRLDSTTRTLRNQADLLNLTHDAIFVRDMNDIVTYWNRGAEKLYGWRSAEAVGRTSHSLTQTSLPLPQEEITAQLLRAGYWDGQLSEIRRDGTRVTVVSRWSLQRDERGQPAAILETNTDVEEQKRAEETLAKAQAELAHVSRVATLGELTASIAHEVNQPLAAIVTSGEACLRWLDRDKPQLDGVRRGVERMIKDGRRASEVIDRLRALSKKSTLRKAQVDINDVVDDTILLIQREISTHRVVLQLELSRPLPSILGDRVQLQQVLINLLMNAIQAMDASDGRKLVIRTYLDDRGHVVCAVRDSGPGFDPDDEGRLFDAFFSTKQSGMGMGLSISRSIIEAHGGRVWASRNAEGGATFQFALPQYLEVRHAPEIVLSEK
jgi:PAS domain S-box-containing protein